MHRLARIFICGLSVIYIFNFLSLIKTLDNDVPMEDSSPEHLGHFSTTPVQHFLPLEKHAFDPVEYERQRKDALIPFTNVTTVAYPHGPFGGFRNQYMTFTGVMLMVSAANHSQIIVNSIKWKDLWGTNERIRHDLFFDIVHWNSFYPTLPRFCEYDSALYPDVKFLGNLELSPSIRWNVEDPFEEAKDPYAIGKTGLQAQNQYKQYVKSVVEGKQEKSVIDLEMLKGAFRPHPAIQQIIDDFLQSDGISSDYMALHARIEPDMQKHNMCTDKKVTNLTDILVSLEETFPVPPVSRVLFILNRDILEKEVADETIDNELAKYNLDVLNQAIEKGLWSGKVEAFEAGIGLAKSSSNPFYSKYASLTGSIIDFFLAVGARMFVGTEVSSFSVDVEITRFYRGHKENYHYIPGKVELTTLLDSEHPPRFKC